MPAIEPGERFTVSYGNDHTIEVVALSLRQKRQVTSDLKQVQQLKDSPESIGMLYEICEAMLRSCVPDIDESLLDELDETMAMEIVGNTLGVAAVSEDEAKK